MKKAAKFRLSLLNLGNLGLQCYDEMINFQPTIAKQKDGYDFNILHILCSSVPS